MKTTARNLTPTDLMKGVWFTLEQCGKLLLDAVLLYRADRLASAVGLTMVARDELGKYFLLLDLWVDASAGQAVDVSRLKENHVEKQRRAAVSATLGEGDDDERIGTFEKLKAAPWGSPEFQRVFASLGDAQTRKNDRERAFYVDPSDGGWSRPCEAFSRSRAERLLGDALNDYRGQYDPINRMLHFKDRRPGLHEALEKWTDKPELPEMPVLATPTSLV